MREGVANAARAGNKADNALTFEMDPSVGHGHYRKFRQSEHCRIPFGWLKVERLHGMLHFATCRLAKDEMVNWLPFLQSPEAALDARISQPDAFEKKRRAEKERARCIIAQLRGNAKRGQVQFSVCLPETAGMREDI